MKKNILSIFSLCALMGLSGCNAFLELEPLDKVSPEQLLETEGGVKALLANIYTMIPMEDFNYRPNNGFNQRGYDGVNETTKLLQKSEMRKNMVMDLIYRGFIYAANYSESHYNPRRSQIKTELRYLFVTTLNR